MLLSKNATPDRLKAITYIEQGVTVLGDHAQEHDDRGEASVLECDCANGASHMSA